MGLVPGRRDSLFLSLLQCIKSQNVVFTAVTSVELRRILVDGLLKVPQRYGMSGAKHNLRRELRLMRHS